VRQKRHWAEDGPVRDVGALVLHQFLTPDAVLPLDFLGSGAFSLVGERPRRVESGDIRFRDDWLFTDDAPDDERAKRFRALARGYGQGSQGTQHTTKKPQQIPPGTGRAVRAPPP